MHASFMTAARRLNFAITPPDPGPLTQTLELSGVAGGHHVRVRRELMIRRLVVEVFFEPAFDLGLHLAPAGQPRELTPSVNLRRIGRLFSRADLRVGDEAVDDAFAIHGDEESRVATLVEAVRADLLAWFASEVVFDLDDARVRMRRYSSLSTGQTADDLRNDVGAAVALAQKLEAVRSLIPVAAPLRPHAESFRRFAAAHGLPFTTAPLATWGPLGDLVCWAHATRLGPASFEIEAGLHPQGGGALPIEGTVHPVTTLNRGAAGRTGDPAFDEVFVAEGPPLAARMTPSVKEGLLTVARAGFVVALTPQGITLRAPAVAEALAIGEALERSAAVLRELARSP